MRAALLVDVCIAVGLAVLVLIVSPGLAITALLALLVLTVCAVSFGISRGRRARAGRRRTPRRRPSTIRRIRHRH